MYLQITTRCNLLCGHCCFSCTQSGSDMPLDIARKSIDLACDNGDSIAIGGGEPTLHDDFEKILCYAIARSDTELMPFIVTNGTIPEHTLLIATLSKHGVIHGGVSIDEWHENKYDNELRNIFKKNVASCDDLRFIRSIQNPISSGRGSTILSSNDGCCCSDFLVQTDGKIRFCGCLDSPIVGDVDSGIWNEWLEKSSMDLSERCYKYL